MAQIKLSARATSTGTSAKEVLPAPGAGKQYVVRKVTVATTPGTASGAIVTLLSGSTEKWRSRISGDASRELADDLIGPDGRSQFEGGPNEAVNFKLDRAGTDVECDVVYEVIE